VPRSAKSRMCRTETPKSIWIKFCAVVDIPDAVSYTNFGDHRLRGFWVSGGQISPSPIDFYRRPYNTLALPCERVSTANSITNKSALSVANSPVCQHDTARIYCCAPEPADRAISPARGQQTRRTPLIRWDSLTDGRRERQTFDRFIDPHSIRIVNDGLHVSCR